ncbi:tRNA (adenosine(37)-N6)-dimethylallyltransferase MiaA [Eubacteriales bacterium KG127]
MKIPIIIVAGPTAVGKTSFAIKLAKKLNGEIVNCDSMQIYKYMNIGSAKPSQAELAEVSHHLVDFVDPRDEFTVAKYQTLGRRAIYEIHEKGKIPIISGGTGLYIDSIIYDMDFSAKPEGGIFNKRREELYKLAEDEGNITLYDFLKNLSPVRANKIHPNNVKKIVRAIEACERGEDIEDFSNIGNKPFEDFLPILICLTRDRQELYNRINLRVDLMMEEGLLKEIENLVAAGLTEGQISMKGIGYKELFLYINGKITLEEAIDLIKKNSRHLAKRQLTWFRKYEDMHWINLSQKYQENESNNHINDAINPMEDAIKWITKKLESTTKATNQTI